MTLNNTCPICEKGNLIETDYEDKIIYKNATGNLSGFKCSICCDCKAEITNSKQARHNKLAIVNFRRTTDGLMTTHQIKELIESLGISASEASNIIGGGPIAFHKYINGSVTQSQAVDNILRAIQEDPKVYEILKSVNAERSCKPTQPYQLYIHIGDENKCVATDSPKGLQKNVGSTLSTSNGIFNIFRTV